MNKERKRYSKTLGDHVKDIIAMHLKGDEAAFSAKVYDLVQSEKEKSHLDFAREVEKLMLFSNGKPEHNATPMQRTSTSISSAGSEFLRVTEPDRCLRDVLLGPAGNEVLNKILLEHRKRDLLRSYGLNPSRKLLFVGPPGTGKTALAEALANELGYPLALVRLDSLVSSYLGVTAVNLKSIFDYARSRAVVLFFDEVDTVAKHRDAGDDHGELKRVVTSLLQMIDFFTGPSLLIAASNHEHLLDSAMWRRFDEIVKFDLPNSSQILALISRLFRQISVEGHADLHYYSEQLLGCSYADAEKFSIDAIKLSLISGVRAITKSSLDEALSLQKSRNQVLLIPSD